MYLAFEQHTEPKEQYKNIFDPAYLNGGSGDRAMLQKLFAALGLTSKGVDEAKFKAEVIRSLVVTSSIHSQPETPSAELPPKDAWEGWYNPIEGGDFPLVIEADIKYTDREGQKTHRRISTKRFGPDPYGKPDDLMVIAFCHLRNENRTFVTSRIAELVNVGTGEVVHDTAPYFRRLYNESPAGQTVRLLETVDDEFTILLYVARSDGRVSPKEKRALIDFLSKIGPEVEIDADTVTEASHTMPTQRQLKAALKAVIARNRAGVVLEALETMEAARTKMDDFTGAAISLIRKQLNQGSPKTT